MALFLPQYYDVGGFLITLPATRPDNQVVLIVIMPKPRADNLIRLAPLPAHSSDFFICA